MVVKPDLGALTSVQLQIIQIFERSSNVFFFNFLITSREQSMKFS